MSEKKNKNTWLENFADKLKSEKNLHLLEIERCKTYIKHHEEQLIEIYEALDKVGALVDEDKEDDESDDKVMEAAEEKFEGNRERFE